jgi:hypothetical protein
MERNLPVTAEALSLHDRPVAPARRPEPARTARMQGLLGNRAVGALVQRA